MCSAPNATNRGVSTTSCAAVQGARGDPGLSRFYLSLDDNLLRIFLSDRVKRFMRGLGLEHGESIEHRMATRSIEKAQYRVEARNFEIRKQLLEYDNIADIQRKVIYGQRRELLAADDISENIIELRQSVIDEVLNEFVPPNALPEQWDIPGAEHCGRALFCAAAAAVRVVGAGSGTRSGRLGETYRHRSGKRLP